MRTRRRAWTALTRGGLAVILILAAGRASRPAAGAPPPLVVSVGGPAEDPAYLPVYAAAALGLFETEGVQVALRRAKHPTAAVDALRDGEASVAVTTMDQAVRGGWARGTPVRVLVAHTRAPATALLVPARAAPPIRRIEDLRGKQVGIPGPGTTGHLVLLALLRAAGVEPWQVSVQSLGGARLVTRLATGDLAAAVVDEPWASQALSAGAATALLDLRQPEVAERALRGPFHEIVSVVRSEAAGGKAGSGKGGAVAKPAPPAADAEAATLALTAFARALIRVQAWLATAEPAAVADRLPTLAGDRARFVARLGAFRPLYTGDGVATTAGLEATLRILRGGSPWPLTLTLGPGDLGPPPFVSAARASLGPHPAPP